MIEYNCKQRYKTVIIVLTIVINIENKTVII